MKRLSNHIGELKDYYPIVIIGSGYGGSIAASRLSRAGQQVCVLERGKEHQPGEFPNTARSIFKASQFDTLEGHRGSSTGLFDFHLNKEIQVLVGCGLGGTSLINANVAMFPERNIFEQPFWPTEIQNDLDQIMTVDFRRAKEMLDPSPYPTSFPTLKKLDVLENMANDIDEKFERTDINVNFKEFQDYKNPFGIVQQPCKLCGDCVSGCNYSAKNTLAMNYLPDARNHGAEIYTQTKVTRLEYRNNRWVVYFHLMDYGREKFDSPELFVLADKVVLAAGTLGSSEILLRSTIEGKKLNLSSTLGNRFSTNGDFIGFGYNGDERVNTMGFGNRSLTGKEPVGPCITGIISMRENRPPKDQMLIEDGTVQGGSVNTLLSLGFDLADIPLGKPTDRGLWDWIKEKWRQFVSLFFPRYGANGNTQIYLTASYDNSGGKMVLEDNRLRINWPNAARDGSYEKVSRKMFEATKTIGGSYIRNPLFSKFFGYDLITAHPLGGCVVGEDVTKGVINHKCQVFNGETPTSTYEGLYVMDGSIVPTALGINPLITISSLSERACRLMAADNNWHIDYQIRNQPIKPLRQKTVGVQFTEKMGSYFSTKYNENLHPYQDMQRYFDAETQGKADKSPFDYVLTVLIDDMDGFLRGSPRVANTLGTVIAPKLSNYPITVTNGRFEMFVEIPGCGCFQRLYYTMELTTVEGERYFFNGFKNMRKAWRNSAWSDTSIMYFTIHKGHHASDVVVGTGIVRMNFFTWLIQLSTTGANNTNSFWQKIKSGLRFAWWFFQSLFKIYGISMFLPGRKKKKWRPTDGCDKGNA